MNTIALARSNSRFYCFGGDNGDDDNDGGGDGDKVGDSGYGTGSNESQ